MIVPGLIYSLRTRMSLVPVFTGSDSCNIVKISLWDTTTHLKKT